MKRIVVITICLLIAVLSIVIMQDKGYPLSGKDSGDLIRFHVMANSDSLADQTLKLKVRDRVLEKMTPMLEGINDIEEARKVINSNLGLINTTASEVVRQYGYNYSVGVSLGQYQFPEKTYNIEGGSRLWRQGQLTLPAGEYQAVRIVLGSGQGANWWCVLFPPLCFVSPAVVTVYVPTEEIIRDLSVPAVDSPAIGGLTSGDCMGAQYFDLGTYPQVSAATDAGGQVEYRFKIFELLRRF